MQHLNYARFRFRRSSSRAISLVIVTLCFVLDSFIIFIIANVYGSIRGVDVFLRAMIPTILLFFVAYGVALAAKKSAPWIKCGLMIFCLIPPAFLLLKMRNDETKLRQDASAKMFCEIVETPIPTSVARVRFETLADWAHANTILHFEIGSADLDRFLKDRGFVKISEGKWLQKIEPFNDPRYLMIGPDDELYQFMSSGRDVFTLRVRKDHREAVLRWDTL